MANDILNRPMFQNYQIGGPVAPMQGGPVAPMQGGMPQQQGIDPSLLTQGATPQEQQAVEGILSALENATGFEDIINLIRGDDRSIDERYQTNKINEPSN